MLVEVVEVELVPVEDVDVVGVEDVVVFVVEVVVEGSVLVVLEVDVVGAEVPAGSALSLAAELSVSLQARSRAAKKKVRMGSPSSRRRCHTWLFLRQLLPLWKRGQLRFGKGWCTHGVLL